MTNERSYVNAVRHYTNLAVAIVTDDPEFVQVSFTGFCKRMPVDRHLTQEEYHDATSEAYFNMHDYVQEGL